MLSIVFAVLVFHNHILVNNISYNRTMHIISYRAMTVTFLGTLKFSMKDVRTSQENSIYSLYSLRTNRLSPLKKAT